MKTGELILIVDDEVQIRRLLEITLTANGFKISEAATGKEGLNLASQHQPELIILDLGLPDIEGFDVLKRLREWYEKPIIILSVRNSEDDIIRALDNGANDYLTKPFRTGELLARIRVAIRQNKSPDKSPLFVFGNITIDLDKHVACKNNEIIKLTSTEFSLFSLTREKFRQSAYSPVYSKGSVGDWAGRADTISSGIYSSNQEKN